MTTGPQPASVNQSQTTIRKTVASHSYQRSVVEVHQEFDQLNPQAIGDACQAWKRAADELLALADGLKAQAATPLNAAWTAPSSPASQQQLQQAEATARALASDCMQMAHATDYAAQYAQWYKDNMPAYTDSVATGLKGLVTGNGLTAGADAATEHMVKLLGRYNEVIQILPSSVQLGLVDSHVDTGGPPPPPPPISNGGAGARAGTAHAGGMPGIGSPGATSGHGTSGAGLPGSSGAGTSGLGSPGAGSGLSGSGIGAGSSGLGAADPYAAGSSLAGTGLGGGLSSFDPGALGSGGTGLSGGAGGGFGGGLGAGALGATGLGAGGLAGGLGAGSRGSGLAGSGLGGSGGVGSLAGQGIGGTGAGLAGEGAGGAGAGRGAGTAPMHGAGGQGEGEEERERSTWLMEDDDVWGTGGDVPPPVITS